MFNVTLNNKVQFNHHHKVYHLEVVKYLRKVNNIWLIIDKKSVKLN